MMKLAKLEKMVAHIKNSDFYNRGLKLIVWLLDTLMQMRKNIVKIKS